MTPPILISASQRDVLYERIRVDLSGIDGLYRVVEEEGDFAKADRLSRKFCDDLHLVIDDFGGWGERSDSRSTELKSPPELLRRVLERFRAEAEEVNAEIEMLRPIEENQRLMTVCDELLAELEGEGAPE